MTARRFAFLVGNHHYDNPNLAQLSASIGDATDFEAVLKDEGFGGFDEVITLIDRPMDEIRKGMARFFSGRSREDLLLLYFSGHGVLDDRGRLYLAAMDTEPDLLSATAIDAAFVTDAMDRCRSTSQVLILDCCHSGAFARGAKGVVGSSVGTATAFQGTGSGRVILTATDATQYAWEGDQIIGQADNSLFTHYLIEGLRTGKADLNQDGWVTLDEWYDYVFDQVITATPKQTPAKWSYKQQGEIWVARNPHPAPKAATLPKELQESLSDPRAWVREGAAAELTRLLNTSPDLTQAVVSALQGLAHDDSRRVSSAAAAGLAAYQSHEGQEVSIAPQAIEADTETNPQAMSGLPIVTLQASAVPVEDASAMDISQGTAVAAVSSGTRDKISTFTHLPSWIKSPFFPVVSAWCLGWLLSLGLALLGDDSRLLFLGWAIAGAGGDLALWRFYRSSHLSQRPLLTLGWPLSLTPVAIFFSPLYATLENAGFDVGKVLVAVSFVLLWMALAGLITTLRILPEDQGANRRQLVLNAVLCWGAAFLLSLVITGIDPWGTSLIHFTNGATHAVLENLNGELSAYFALSLNGIITAALGFTAWSWLHRKSQN